MHTLARLAKTDLLVIDDWALALLTSPEQHDLLEILENLTGRASTLMTSQAPVKAWHEFIGEHTIADSICDRLIHTAYVIELAGPSRREVQAKMNLPDGGDIEPPASLATKPSGPRKRPSGPHTGAATLVAPREGFVGLRGDVDRRQSRGVAAFRRAITISATHDHDRSD